MIPLNHIIIIYVIALILTVIVFFKDYYKEKYRKIFSLKLPLVKYKERMLKESGWEKEFEDEVLLIKVGGMFNFVTDKYSLINLAKKYLKCNKIENILKDNIPESTKIKIRCKDGLIQIERIK